MGPRPNCLEFDGDLEVPGPPQCPLGTNEGIQAQNPAPHAPELHGDCVTGYLGKIAHPCDVPEKIDLAQVREKIKILEILLEKERNIKAFLEKLNGQMSDESKEILERQMESRLDEECNFFLRFSKEKLINEKELWLTDQGNCFHIKINVAAFPKKREIAMEIIRKVFILKS